MKILFSPSETKNSGGIKQRISKDSFIFPTLFEKRMEAVECFQNYINNGSEDVLSTLFGTKKREMIEYYRGDLMEKEILKGVERYAGVAYEYLDYNNLDLPQKGYVDKNVIIFSNLFGPILAGDIGVPDYKLKQGEGIGDFTIESFYNKNFSSALDEYLKDEEVIDLRAGFYERFYSLKKPYLVLKFVKDGKVVSHWAKAYRGIVLREMAKNNVQSIEQFMDLQIENLSVIEIKKQKLKREVVYLIRS